MTSRILAGAIAGMVGVNTIIAITAYQGVPVEIALSGIAAVAGLGGFQVMRQARIDEVHNGNSQKQIPEAASRHTAG